MKTRNLFAVNFQKTRNLDGSTAELAIGHAILVIRYPVLTAVN